MPRLSRLSTGILAGWKSMRTKRPPVPPPAPAPSAPPIATVSSPTITEAGNLVFTVTLVTAPVGLAASFPISLGGGTATSGTDYTATLTNANFSSGVTIAGSTITVPVGVGSFTVTVATTSDTIDELDETTQLVVGGVTGIGTITDDDAAPTIASVSDASGTEGSTLVHTVTLSNASYTTTSHSISFTSITATAAVDYLLTSFSDSNLSNGVTYSLGTVYVPAGVVSFTVSVDTDDDAIAEGTETYQLTVGTATGTGTILDNDSVDSMALGYNVNVAPYANLMWQASAWQDPTNGYEFHSTQNQGLFTTSFPLVEYVLTVAQVSDNLPGGTYTWRNPDGNNIKIIDSDGATLVAYTTTTGGTFVLPAGKGIMILCKGGMTNSAGTRLGAFQIIIPGHTASWDAGDYFSTSWVNFHTTLGTSAIRTMDLGKTNSNLADTWARRTDMTGCTFSSKAHGIPFEVQLAMGVKLGVPVWMCVPTRFDDAAVASLATLINTTIAANPGLEVWLEYGNEIWNFGNSRFRNNTWWVTRLTFTKGTLAVSGSTFTKTAHGWLDDQRINTYLDWQSREVWANEEASADYYDGIAGGTLYVKVLTANTFELYRGAGATGGKITCPALVTQVIYDVWNEPAHDMHGNYATRAKQIWDIVDGICGAGVVKAVMAGQSADVGLDFISNRLANPTIHARVDYYADAPYYFPILMGGAIDRTSNTFTPKLWASHSVDATFRVYAAGATPTDPEIVAGTGQIASTTISHTYTGTPYTSGAGVAVVDGTSYKTYFVAVDSRGFTWIWGQTVAAAAVTDTVDVLDTYANQAMRAMAMMDDSEEAYQNIVNLAASKVAALAALNPDIQLVGYEGHSHDDQSTYNKPASILSWHESLQESSEQVAALVAYVNLLAASGYKKFFLFTDGEDQGPWGIADDVYDTSDPRFVALSAFAGQVPITTPLSLDAVEAWTATDPGAFPHTVHTFADATLTYSIVSGNSGNYAFSGANLQMVNNTGINFAVSVERILKCRATNGSTNAFFDVSVGTGPAVFYQVDDLAAFRGADDASNTEITQSKGGTIPLSAGSASTISGGYWNSNGGQYADSAATTATIATATEDVLMMLAVSDPDGEAAGGEALRLGVVPMMIFGKSGGGNWDCYIHNGTVDTGFNFGVAANSTKRVLWVWWDSVNQLAHWGVDNTPINPSAPTGDSIGITFPASFSRYLSTFRYNVGGWRVSKRVRTRAEVLSEVAQFKTDMGV